MPIPKPRWDTLNILLATMYEAPITTDVLCKRFGVNKATLYRYVRILRAKGADIERYYYNESDRRLCAWVSKTPTLSNLSGKTYS